MPERHRPEQLAALAEAVSVTAEHAGAADTDLLDHAAIAGDRATQAALDGMVDHALEALRELSASCREVSLALAADGAVDHRAPTTTQPVWESR